MHTYPPPMITKVARNTLLSSNWGQYLLFFLSVASLLNIISVSALVPTLQVNALFKLHNSTRGESWHWKDELEYGQKWNFSRDSSGMFTDDPCSSGWQGVTCSGSPLACSSQLCHILGVYLPGYAMAGNIPSEMGDLEWLMTLVLYNNALTGTIPRELGGLLNLQRLSIYSSFLTGTIPAELGNLVDLEIINLSDNLLTGTIPAEMGSLVRLKYLHMGMNILTGSIPTEVGNLVDLIWFVLFQNSLTGPIPKEVGHFVNMRIFVVHINSLTGTIPSELSNVVNLQWLIIHNNTLSGSIPSEIYSLTNLERLVVGINALTGSIPREVGRLASLVWLVYRDSAMTGTIPSEVGTLVKLEWLELGDNRMTGTIPPELSNLGMAQYIFLQANQFVGQIDRVFNSSLQKHLEVVDLSDNQLTGPYGADLFRLPVVEVIALSVNCFEEELPPSMCEARSLEVLSLNGLGAASRCKNFARIPFFGVSIFDVIGGTLPQCVWHLPSLAVLHAVGNGMGGRLVARLPNTSRLADLALSHNLFTGSIPIGIQRVNRVDLSYNHFSGEYAHNDGPFSSDGLNLDINRLSGVLPLSALENVTDLNVLQGNMFSCDSLPSNDKFKHDCSCGSKELDEAIRVFGLAILITGSTFLAIYFLSTLQTETISSPTLKHVVTFSSQLRMYIGYVDQLDKQDVSLQPLIALVAKFKEAIKLFFRLFALIVLVSVPIYIVRGSDNSGEFSTHKNTYAWFWTLAYMRGVTPAALVLMMWSVALGVCFYFVMFNPLLDAPRATFSLSRDNVSLESDERVCGDVTTAAVRHDVPLQRVEEGHATATKAFLSWKGIGLLLFVAALSITVNSLYVNSSSIRMHYLLHFLIRVGLAVFKLIYAFGIMPLLFQSIVDPVANILFWMRLLIVDTLVIPCLVVAFASPSCFQGLMVPADEVSTPYSFEQCTIYNLDGPVPICEVWESIDVASVPVVAPFMYNNQCASLLLTSFVPVLIIEFSIQLVAILVLPVICYYLGNGLSANDVMVGILWPHYWLNNVDSERFRNKIKLEDDPYIIVNLKSVMCFDVLNMVIIMLTFGLSSPVLAAVVACAAAMKLALLILLVGRFASVLRDAGTSSNISKSGSRSTNKMKSRSQASNGNNFSNRNSVDNGFESDCNTGEDLHFALETLCNMPFPLAEVLQQSFWLFAWASASFFVLGCFDMALDEVDVVQALWIPVWALSFPVLLWFIGYFISGQKNGDKNAAFSFGGGGGGGHVEMMSSGASRPAPPPPASSSSSSFSPLRSRPPPTPAAPRVDSREEASLSPQTDFGCANPMHGH